MVISLTYSLSKTLNNVQIKLMKKQKEIMRDRKDSIRRSEKIIEEREKLILAEKRERRNA
ncbi:hypothetical protein SAMN02745728_02231 [Desulfovibrio litoralis DSM 11393]|uniref:Uncharacterized protein n=1 Tax=Desulfovibrio litoralis DSM 11393 TaxID=1121455 RepID=A0A1M7TLV2_9BACT|nr:hypothetical protein SAMN02745728_02231 [Desulfovibrio litoralis DSM 11393]